MTTADDGRGVAPVDPAEGSREQGEYAERRVEREQEGVERGAAEEASGAPLTETEEEVSRRGHP
jgi:hypothetical protein